MPFNLIPSIIIFLCIAGIFVLFIRRLPEVVQEQGQLSIATATAAAQAEVDRRTLKEFSKNGVGTIFGLLKRIWNKLWGFVLEAKDLQQSQAIAVKLNKIIPKKGKPANIGVYNQLKKAERQVVEGHSDAAEQTYFGIIRKHPLEYQAYEGLIKIYTDTRNYDDIVEILEFLISHNPDNDTYYAKLGNTHLLMKHFQDAIAAYQRALEINALVPARYVNIALAYKALHEVDASIPYLQKAVDLEPGNMQYLMMMVDSLEKSGKIDEAVAVLEKAEQNNPKDKEIKARIKKLKPAPQDQSHSS